MRCIALIFACAAVLACYAGTAHATAEPITECNAEVIWTNPNPGTCVTVKIKVSVQNPDSSVNITTTGQDGGGPAIWMGAGYQHTFNTRYDSITAHELLVPVTVMFIIT